MFLHNCVHLLVSRPSMLKKAFIVAPLGIENYALKRPPLAYEAYGPSISTSHDVSTLVSAIIIIAATPIAPIHTTFTIAVGSFMTSNTSVATSCLLSSLAI